MPLVADKGKDSRQSIQIDSGGAPPEASWEQIKNHAKLGL